MHGPSEGVSEETDEANSAVKIVGGNVFVELDPDHPGFKDEGYRSRRNEIAKIARRSIVAKNDLSANTRLEWNHLDWVRPGDGLPPGEEDQLLGKFLKRDVPRGYLILPEDVS